MYIKGIFDATPSLLRRPDRGERMWKVAGEREEACDAALRVTPKGKRRWPWGRKSIRNKALRIMQPVINLAAAAMHRFSLPVS